MNDTDRLQLRFGTYRTPRFKYGQIVARDVVIVGLTMPNSVTVGSRSWCKGRPSPVLYRGLIKAVKKESAQAVLLHRTHD